MTEDRASISIRMPRSLLDELKAAAQAESHSMNAEIVQRLKSSFLERNDQETEEERAPDVIEHISKLTREIYDLGTTIIGMEASSRVNDATIDMLWRFREQLVFQHKRLTQFLGYNIDKKGNPYVYPYFGQASSRKKK